MQKLTLVRQFLNKKEKNVLNIVFVLMFVSALLEILSIGAIIPLFSFLLKGNFNYVYEIFNITNFNLENSNLILLSIILLITIFFLKNLFLIIFSWIDSSFYYKVGKRISDEVFKNYLHSKYLFLINKKNSKLIFNSSDAIKMFRNALMSFTQIINECTVFFGISIFLAYLDYKVFSLIFISLIAIMFTISFSIRNLNLRLGRGVKRYENRFINSIIQSFNTIKDIKIKKKEDFFFSEFEQNNFLRTKYSHLNFFIGLIPKYIIEFVILCIVLISIFFYSKFNNDFDLLIIKIGILSAAAVRLLPSVFRIITSFQRLNFCFPLLKDLKKEILENKKNLIINKKTKKKLNQDIYFKDFKAIKIKFRYPGNTKKAVIENLNIKLQKKRITLISGKTGSGKTTLLDLLTGLIEPEKGFFQINGKKYKNLPDFWIDNIAYVSQNIALLNSSILRNITFGDEGKKVDNKKLKSSIINSQLKSFIKSQKNGVNANIGEKGVKISGGERQRIALARAFYSNKKVLILDEATNALDKKIEYKIFKYLKNESLNKIVVVISHDLSLNKFCDNVIKINKGKAIYVKQ